MVWFYSGMINSHHNYFHCDDTAACIISLYTQVIIITFSAVLWLLFFPFSFLTCIAMNFINNENEIWKIGRHVKSEKYYKDELNNVIKYNDEDNWERQ